MKYKTDNKMHIFE